MELVDLGYEYLRRSEELINHIHNLKEQCEGLCGNEKADIFTVFRCGELSAARSYDDIIRKAR